MIIDFDQMQPELIAGHNICIIGSGAASLAMLTQLYDTGLKVIVLEAGGEEITDTNQEIYRTTNTHYDLPGVFDGRFRVFGGSTTKWGGQSLHLEPGDFTAKDWIPNSGWPIEYNEVAKYYPQVDNFLNLYPNDYGANIYDLIKQKPLKTSTSISLKFSKWSPLPNLRENYRKALLHSQNITLVQNANVMSVNLNDDLKSVVSVTVGNFSGKKVEITALKYIMSCGGIETPRLLLASNKQQPTGVGNDHDNVGRYLQDHPNAHIGTLQAKSKMAQQYFNYFYIQKTRFLPRFVFSKQFLDDNKLLNSSAYFSFVTDDDDPFSIIKEIYRKYRRHELFAKEFKPVFKLIANIPDLVAIAGAYFFSKKIYTPKAVLKLNLMTETPPLFENRVSLSKETDVLGMPKAIISWHANELILHTFKHCAAFIKEYFDDLGLGEFELDNWINEANWFNHIKDAKHHIGTTRMSNDAETGVVDSDCKVFNIDNLYIAGSSVFPTSGHSNPTSTILALSFRLIEHIKQTLND